MNHFTFSHLGNKCLNVKKKQVAIVSPYGVVWWYGMVGYGMAWHGMAWHGMAWYIEHERCSSLDCRRYGHEQNGLATGFHLISTTQHNITNQQEYKEFISKHTNHLNSFQDILSHGDGTRLQWGMFL